MGKANEIQANLQSAYCQSVAVKSQNPIIDDVLERDTARGAQYKSISQSDGFGKTLNSSFSNGSDAVRTMNGKIFNYCENSLPEATKEYSLEIKKNNCFQKHCR